MTEKFATQQERLFKEQFTPTLNGLALGMCLLCSTCRVGQLVATQADKSDDKKQRQPKTVEVEHRISRSLDYAHITKYMLYVTLNIHVGLCKPIEQCVLAKSTLYKLIRNNAPKTQQAKP